MRCSRIVNLARKPIDFCDSKEALRSKSFTDLLRSYIVLSVCQKRPIIKRADKFLRFSYRYLGKFISDHLLKISFYGHFCAGENELQIKPVIGSLLNAGIGSILDYASEGIDGDNEPIINTASTQCRLYTYENERTCDENVRIFERAIKAATTSSRPHSNNQHYSGSDSTNIPGFSALKCTALGDPTLLQAISTKIVNLNRFFDHFEDSGIVSLSHFMEVYDNFFKTGDPHALYSSFVGKRIDKFVDWEVAISTETLCKFAHQCRESDLPFGSSLKDGETQALHRLISRVDHLASVAYAVNVRLMIDAEHSYYQPAIDFITRKLARKYNQAFPTIFATHQMYLKDSYERLLLDVKRADHGNYIFATKLVRGAYMSHERSRAEEMGSGDPVYSTIDETHANYNKAMSFLLSKIAEAATKSAGTNVEFMLASHNQRSVELATQAMDQLGLNHRRCGVYFGTLLGMADHLSYPLGAGGYRAYKYVPYGPVQDVIPYLLRRAQENADVMAGAAAEARFIKSEIMRRLLSPWS